MVHYAGLFSPEGRPMAGNLQRVPPSLTIDGPAQRALFPAGRSDTESQIVRGIARKLPNGSVLVIGRNVDEGKEVGDIVGEALALGLLPAFCLSIAAGVLLTSARAEARRGGQPQSPTDRRRRSAPAAPDHRRRGSV